MKQATTNNRPSFLLYKSFYAPVHHLKDDELGLLFRALFDYQNGLEIKELSPQVGMAFAFFKNQFDLDEQKYQTVLERNKSNGSKGGRPKKEETQANPENPVGFYEPKKGEKEKEKENGTDKDNKLLAESQFESFWQSYKSIHTSKGVKEQAKQSFKKALANASFDEIERGLKNYMADCHSKNIYTKQVSVWLNKQGWKSEYSTAKEEMKSEFAKWKESK